MPERQIDPEMRIYRLGGLTFQYLAGEAPDGAVEVTLEEPTLGPEAAESEHESEDRGEAEAEPEAPETKTRNPQRAKQKSEEE